MTKKSKRNHIGYGPAMGSEYGVALRSRTERQPLTLPRPLYAADVRSV